MSEKSDKLDKKTPELNTKEPKLYKMKSMAIGATLLIIGCGVGIAGYEKIISFTHVKPSKTEPKTQNIEPLIDEFSSKKQMLRVNNFPVEVVDVDLSPAPATVALTVTQGSQNPELKKEEKTKEKQDLIQTSAAIQTPKIDFAPLVFLQGLQLGHVDLDFAKKYNEEFYNSLKKNGFISQNQLVAALKNYTKQGSLEVQTEEKLAVEDVEKSPFENWISQFVTIKKVEQKQENKPWIAAAEKLEAKLASAEYSEVLSFIENTEVLKEDNRLQSFTNLLKYHQKQQFFIAEILKGLQEKAE